jgi:hypothetical protein
MNHGPRRHRCIRRFEWCDPKAAELYREHQANHLIKQVRVVVQPRDPEPVVRARADIPEGEYHAEPVEDYDPLQFELSEALGAVVRLIDWLSSSAPRRPGVTMPGSAWRLMWLLPVWRAAEEAVADAEEALQNVHTPKVWHPAVAAH